MGLKWQNPLEISRTHNVIWNGASRLIQVGLQFLFVPIYIHILGPASYALVVLSATLMAVFSFFDHISTSTVSRIFGMNNSNAEQASSLRGVMSRLEPISLAIACAIAVLAPVLGSFATRSWSAESPVGPSELKIALILIGGVLTAQFLGLLYTAGLHGLQRQKLVSVIRMVWTPAYYGIGALLLLWIERSVVVLFAWQMIAFLALAAVLRWLLFKTLPVGNSNTLSKISMPDIARFSTGAVLMALTVAVVGQIDKFMVADAVQPTQFAAYGIAFSIVMQVMTLVSGSFAMTLFPHFAQMIADRNDAELRSSYHKGTQMIVLFSIVGGAALYWLGPLLIDLWLGSGSVLAPDTKRLMPVFVLAWVLNSMVVVPTILIWASGHLALIYGINLGAIFLALLFLPSALAHYGLEAGAVYWLLVNVSYCVIMVPLLHRFILQGSLLRWLIRDVGLPLLVGAIIVYGAGQISPPSAPDPVRLVVVAAIVSFFCFFALLGILPEARRQIAQSVSFLRR